MQEVERIQKEIILWNNEFIKLYQIKMENCNLVKYNVKEKFKELNEICKTFCKKKIKVRSRKLDET